jgi:hypothetical protein
MSSTSDPELLEFSAELLQQYGGLIELPSKGLLALLPEELAKDLGLPEEVQLGTDEAPLLYGSPLLDRLVEFATRDVPVTYGQIEVPYLKKAGFEQLFGQDLRFVDGLVRIASRAQARTSYLVLMCRFVALSDERREGLVEVVLHEGSGVLIPELVGCWQDFQPQFFAPGKVPPHFPVHLDQTISSGLACASDCVRKDLADFLGSMQRRLQRDVRNTREYYAMLQAEMSASAKQPNLSEGQRQERLAKMDDLPGEMNRKIQDLEQKYRVRVSVFPCAGVRLLVDVVQLLVELKYRKFQRSLKMTWNPLTRRLDQLLCEECRKSTRKIQPLVKQSTIQLVCFPCSQRK